MPSTDACCAAHAQIEALDASIQHSLKLLAEHKRRRTMLAGFAHSPSDFITGLLATQVGLVLSRSVAQPGDHVHTSQCSVIVSSPPDTTRATLAECAN